ncbi:family 43 glycosylhydrolase [Dysgonomonas sp. Marseille-P4677]|uniref:family 43 glycosylhydrolase n=1 Tax=Dysgonomonas sp. Marseille-P4677 TaxID=2364790 RepID=UPI001911F596|nr:family 43 glycosylhydrolase [Dysgonomonas sp. Marseille-P4677]MBK5720904.1 family 43 glycosylhydrolase [Dysgonomonas sp. Marseille-P4677]
MKEKILCLSVILLLLLSCGEKNDGNGNNGNGGDGPDPPTSVRYENPIINENCPDPSVIKASDGYFYVYSTQNNLPNNYLYLPIHKSKDLVHWDYIGTVFNESNRPKWIPNSKLWAPDINYFNGKYVIYYSMGVWGGTYDSAIGVATADKPEGPFTDHGIVLDYTSQGVNNSIDQFFIEDNGHKYLVWGSFYGIYAVELTDDGLAVKEGTVKVQLAANQIEGSYIVEHGGYFYLIGSAGSCCEGKNSTYHLIFGRSKNVLGPYVTKDGKRMLDGAGDILLQGNNIWAGTGHNAEFVKDDEGSDWIIYHAYRKSDDSVGRLLMLDRIYWDEWGPYVKGNTASISAEAPIFK